MPLTEQPSPRGTRFASILGIALERLQVQHLSHVCLIVAAESVAIVWFVEGEVEVCGFRECRSGEELRLAWRV